MTGEGGGGVVASSHNGSYAAAASWTVWTCFATPLVDTACAQSQSKRTWVPPHRNTTQATRGHGKRRGLH